MPAGLHCSAAGPQGSGHLRCLQLRRPAARVRQARHPLLDSALSPRSAPPIFPGHVCFTEADLQGPESQAIESQAPPDSEAASQTPRASSSWLKESNPGSRAPTSCYQRIKSFRGPSCCAPGHARPVSGGHAPHCALKPRTWPPYIMVSEAVPLCAVFRGTSCCTRRGSQRWAYCPWAHFRRPTAAPSGRCSTRRVRRFWCAALTMAPSTCGTRPRGSW